MVSESDAFAQIRDLIVRETGIRPAKVTADARLVEDLGIDGDDLVELMEAYFEQTRVVLGEYVHADYVGPEGLRLFGKSHATKSLTISVLVTSLQHGKRTPQG